MTLEHRFMQARLDHFLDGELPETERLALEEHLGRCDECLAEVEGLRSVRDAAVALPREIAPPRDLWPEIAARIRAERSAGVVEVDFRPAASRVSRGWWLRIAAGVALVVSSSGVTAWLLEGPPAAPVVTLPADHVEPRPTTALAAFTPTETAYLGTVAALESELELRRGQLSPETVATVEQNLRIIDAAIAEARAALVADPANTTLPHQISSVYRRKVELLEFAVRLTARS